MFIHSTVLLLVGLTPASKLKNLILRLLGMVVPASAKVHPIVLLSSKLILDENCRLAPLSVFRKITLQMGKNSGIGSWNWASSAPKLAHLQPEHAGKLVLGQNSAITMRHYLDCSGGLILGDFVTVAGVRSTFLTHQIDVVMNQQTASPVRIGSYALVSSNCSVVAGATIGEACLVGMGTVVLGKKYPDGVLLVGNPARVVREQSGDYFTRTEGAVSPPEKGAA